MYLLFSKLSVRIMSKLTNFGIQIETYKAAAKIEKWLSYWLQLIAYEYIVNKMTGHIV